MNGRLVQIRSDEMLIEEMKRIGPEPAGLEIMRPKGRFAVIRLEGITCAAANILKQEMLSRGGEVVISNMVYRLQDRTPTNVLVMGTHAQFGELIDKLRIQPLKTLQSVAAELGRLLACIDGPPARSMKIGGRIFNWDERTYVMGIVNVTPDSFSGDGLEHDLERVVAQARRFAESGANLLDIGGESTRPGSAPVSVEEELSRVIPAIRRLKQEVSIPLSIDTSRAEVAEAALNEGAALINDVWGLKKDPRLKDVVGRAQAPVVLMHNRMESGNVDSSTLAGGHYRNVRYDDLMADICHDLREAIDSALAAGIPAELIIVDPGIGFAKTPEQNLHVMRRLGELKSLGYPILLGTSRKSFLGHVLQRPPQERIWGTAASVALGIAGGANIIRVHDVDEMTQVARIADAIQRG